MDTTSAKNFLENTELKFKIKAGATLFPAAFFLVIILFEAIIGRSLGVIDDIYFISGIALLVITGSVLKLLSFALSAFKWGWLLTPFSLIDLVIALSAGAIVLAIGVFFPFVPIGLDTLALYRERSKAKSYL